jgi:hypothetical protein
MLRDKKIPMDLNPRNQTALSRKKLQGCKLFKVLLESI